jgi:hypothetical protein
MPDTISTEYGGVLAATPDSVILRGRQYAGREPVDCVVHVSRERYFGVVSAWLDAKMVYFTANNDYYSVGTIEFDQLTRRPGRVPLPTDDGEQNVSAYNAAEFTVGTLTSGKGKGPVFKKDVVEAYEQGKHRRYGLLFSVNGGALAIGKLAFTAPTAERIVFGGLKVWMLGVVLGIFSALMTFDIWMFGKRMRKLDKGLFGLPGKIVLLSVGGMLTGIGFMVARDFFDCLWMTLSRWWSWGTPVVYKLPPV